MPQVFGLSIDGHSGEMIADLLGTSAASQLYNIDICSEWLTNEDIQKIAQSEHLKNVHQFGLWCGHSMSDDSLRALMNCVSLQNIRELNLYLINWDFSFQTIADLLTSKTMSHLQRCTINSTSFCDLTMRVRELLSEDAASKLFDT